MQCAVGLVMAALTVLTLGQLPSAASGADETPTTRDLAPLRLRGYGELAAKFTSAPSARDGTVSWLAISCENEAKAGIVHAKFVSDLHALSEIRDDTLPVAGIQVPVSVVPRQGVVTALRYGRFVHVLTGPTVERLKEGLASLNRRSQQPDWAFLLEPSSGPLATPGPAGSSRTPAAPQSLLAGAELLPHGQVPMFLQAWDQHGFRFYYRPWETPKDARWKDYQVLGEFDFAKQTGQRGFVFWAETSLADQAVGLDNDLWWDWAARAAGRRQLPIVINTSGADPTWLLNGYRDQLMSLMPQFCGSFHSVADTSSAGMRSVSWCARAAQDAQLAAIRRIAGRYSQLPNTLEYLEPHGELRHGDYDIFLEYGTVADASFRDYLKAKYGSVATVAERWGSQAEIQAWEDVRVPDLASFLGYDAQALDLTGSWRIGYEAKPQPAAEGRKKNPGPNPSLAPAEWFSEKFDDSSWPTITAPGNDRMMFLDKRPAVFRRACEVPANWLDAGEKVWLYVWDLNSGEHLKDQIMVALNGVPIGEDLTRHAVSHWAAFDTGSALRAGVNTVAIRVPKGFLGYHVYLAKHAPRQYPDLPEGPQARWVDFSDWRRWTRLESARRGLEAIRSVDPDRSIICMAPDDSVAGIKQLCQRYGAHFHNTGHMGAFWNEYLPMLMRGADLPFSLEPGGPAGSLPEFKHQLGLYFTEGIQAIHYFIHVGDIYWPREIREHFERIQPLIDTVGKVHPPKAEIAMLFSDRIANLTGFPWGRDPDVNLSSGYFSWPLNASYSGKYDFDGLTDLDFADGLAKPYKVIIGANTSVMDAPLIQGVEDWVRQGGLFVAFVQTGRHAPEKKDAWPISRLSGFEVTGISRSGATPGDPQEVADWWKFTFAPGQSVFPAGQWDLRGVKANGLKLRATAPDCQALALWEDGSVAIGLRPLGKGHVLQLGLKFCREPLWHGWPDRTEKLFRQIFEWAGIQRVPAVAEGVRFRHYVSNNGLFDHWVLWNEKQDQPVDTSLIFRDGLQPAFCREVGSAAAIALAADGGGTLAVPGIHLEPLETKIFVTPRNRLATAPAEWLELQRHWWRGAADVPSAPPPVQTERPAEATSGEVATLDLTAGWKYKLLDENGADDASALAPSAVDDAAWPVRRLDCWAVPEELPSHRVLFRRTFQVPAGWSEGGVELWLRAWFASTVVGQARYWLDGQELTRGDGAGGLIVDKGLIAGSQHTLAVEVRGAGQVCGVRGNTWLAFVRRPAEILELAGPWIPSQDYLTNDPPVSLPGPFRAKLLSRSVELPARLAGKQVYLRMRTSPGLTGCLVNGRYLRRHHHCLGDVTFLNITPWLHAGHANQLEILGPGGDSEIHELALWVY